MTSPEITKIISRNLKRERDTRDIRARVSTRLQEHRRSKRSAALNQLRQVYVPKVVKKKTAAEEKLEKLKAYQAEKLKKMEELKKKQKPPFRTVVKAHHTGGTPFREAMTEKKNKFQPLKLTKLQLPANTRSRTQAQELFEFKATIKPKAPAVSKTAISKLAKEQGVGKPISENKPIKTMSKQTVSVAPVTKKTVPVAPVNKQTVPVGRNNKLAMKSENSKKHPALQNEENAPVERRVLRSRENISYKSTTSVSKPQPKLITNNSKPTEQKADTKTSTRTRTRGRPKSKDDSTSSVKSEPLSSRSSKENNKNKDVESNKKVDKPSYPCNISKNCESESQGSSFQRVRLQNEIARLTSEANSWSKEGETNVPEHIKSDILAVVGQTKLLLSEKFCTFKGLLERYESDQNSESVRVTLDDLEGYWDVMYLEVVQLDQRFKKLLELKNNDWKEEVVVTAKKNTRKIAPKKKSTQVASKFKEFLKTRQNKTEGAGRMTEEVPENSIKLSENKSQQNKIDDNTDRMTAELPESSIRSLKPQDITVESSLYMSVSKDEDMEFGNNTLEILKTPRMTPAIKRVLNSSRRRSSIALLTLQNTHLMKLAASPKL